MLVTGGKAIGMLAWQKKRKKKKRGTRTIGWEKLSRVTPCAAWAGPHTAGV